jgi:DNA-directed RNA polymerase specialized sigma24 family protein
MDQRAFALLFSRRHADVYRFALHMTGAPAIADDVTQDVFMVVMQTRRDTSLAARAWRRGCWHRAQLRPKQRFDRERCLDPLATRPRPAETRPRSSPIRSLT